MGGGINNGMEGEERKEGAEEEEYEMISGLSRSRLVLFFLSWSFVFVHHVVDIPTKAADKAPTHTYIYITHLPSLPPSLPPPQS
jgi:hypothetical protein